MLQAKRYAILASLEAAVGGVTAVIIAAMYQFQPASLRSSGQSMAIAILGGATLLYYLSAHQLLRKTRQKLSAILMSVLTASMLLLIIATTGGLDSPYYSLWLLAIVVAGFFGSAATGLAVGATLVYYGYYFVTDGVGHAFAIGHIAQVIISVMTGIIAEWIHYSIAHSTSQGETLSQLSGKLNQEQLKSEVLMNSMGEGVMVVNQNRQIQLFNPAAVKLTGWDAGSAQGIDYRLVLNLHRADGNKIEDKEDPFLQSWTAGKSLIRDDLVMETKGGHKMELSLSLSPIFDSNHQVSGGICLFRDITDEKEVARQKDEFISTASHEMRTPVAAIEGYLSLAMNSAVATIDTRAKDYLVKAHSSTQHLGELFRDLLSVTKLEDNQKAGEAAAFDLTQMVQDAVGDMQFTAEKKGLEIRFGTAGSTVRGEKSVMPVFAVMANQQRIREVVMNLIENAIKFTPQGRVAVTIGGTDDAVTVAVTDSGIGIAPEDIQHLFQKFYRIDNSSTRTIGGTGLGLYLCRTIIELFGGRIWVESRLGEGSSFKFSLPRLKSDALAAAQAPAPTPAPMPAAAPVAAPAMAATANVAAMTSQPVKVINTGASKPGQ